MKFNIDLKRCKSFTREMKNCFTGRRCLSLYIREVLIVSSFFSLYRTLLVSFRSYRFEPYAYIGTNVKTLIPLFPEHNRSGPGITIGTLVSSP